MTLTAMLGVTGLVIDAGWAYWRYEACYTAAQAAVIGAIQYASIANTTWPPATCNATTAVSCSTSGTTCPSVTLASSPTSVVQDACLWAKQNGFTATGNQNVVITANTGNPPGTSGVTTAYYVMAQVSEKIPLFFLPAIVGRDNNIVSAKSIAAVLVTPASDCIYVLDPAGDASFNASNGVSVTSQCGYWIFSTSSSALSVVGGSTVTATNSTAIDVAGGWSINNGGSTSPAPTKATPPADPFLSRSVPLQRSVTGAHTYSCSYGASGGCAHTSTATYQCDYTSYVANSGGSNVTLSPGVYCGGIQAGNINSLTFQSGVYILDGGGMNLGGLGGISGGITATSGVSFFNTYNPSATGVTATYKPIILGNGANFTGTALSAGSQQGIVFYQDPSITPGTGSSMQMQVNGGINDKIAGAIYLPTTGINFSNGTNNSFSLAVIAYDVVFTGGTSFFKADSTNITTLGGTTKTGWVQ
jgi:hypothetical protein